MEWKSSLLKCLCIRTGFVVLATVLLIVFGVLPLHRKIVNENEETQKVLVGMERAREKVSALGEYRDQFEQLKMHESDVDQSLSESEVASFIAELERMAQESGGDIVVSQGSDPELSRKNAKKDADSKTTPLIDELSGDEVLSLSVRFTGSYPEALEFLHKVETMPYFLDVLSLNISAHEGREASSADRGGILLIGQASGVGRSGSSFSGPYAEAVFEMVVYLE
jgi:Tfp pilus assembly protein PilO